MSENYKFFQHRSCEFFPCHKVSSEDKFNCLFCYCPLYALGDQCGGNFNYTENGVKDCSNCALPHSPGGYDYIMGKFGEIMEIAKR
ncbi:MAG: cysteine-rich small domain-containing protein [Firmicutes bacterium]|nr:cysteine-rich small domain-containing protein [Bacillota bacterium]